MRVVPQDHNKLFEELQNKYLENRTEENLSNMYLLLKDYYKNLFINYARKKNISWSDDVILEKAHDTATRTIEHFIKKPDYKINKLSALGHFDFIKILYQDKNYEMNTESLDDYSIGLMEEENKLSAVKYYNDEYDY